MKEGTILYINLGKIGSDSITGDGGTSYQYSGGGGNSGIAKSNTLTVSEYTTSGGNGLVLGYGGGGAYAYVAFPAPDYNIERGGYSGSAGSGVTTNTPGIAYKGVSYSPTITNGANSGNGKATISFITK